jgi:hypothetical protein
MLLYACEIESAVECGEYGGLQRWQLTIIHLSSGERKLYCYDFLKALQYLQGFFNTGEIWIKYTNVQ